MTKDHQLNCNCYECNDADAGNAESTDDPAYYIGATLLSDSYLTSYSRYGTDSNGNPLGTVVRKFSPGDQIGIVYSYAVDAAGIVWFELQTSSGAPAAEWIAANIPGEFSVSTTAAPPSGQTFNNLLQTQQAIIDTNPLVQGAKQAVQNVSSSLDGLFGDLKWVFIGVVIIVVGIVIMKIKN